MKLSKVFPLALIGVLVATLMFLAPRLGADGGPPSGISSRHEPAAKIDSSSGILPRGTLVEPVVVEPAVEQLAGDGTASNPAGLADELTTTAPAQAEQQAAPELTTDDLKASGLETP